MAGFDITRAAPEERETVANLMQLYTHDFSDFWRDRNGGEGELGPDGRFAEYPLAPYWSDPAFEPLLVREDGYLTGFALLNGVSHSGEPLDRNMGEFFIVRKHRRGGLGTRVARALFARYPGQWEVAVARRNLAALSFWRGAIEGCPGAAQIAERDVTTDLWNGFIFRFRMG